MSRSLFSLFDALADAAKASCPYVVRSADGEVYEQHRTLAAAQLQASTWNAQTERGTRAHTAAYPFRGEAR